MITQKEMASRIGLTPDGVKFHINKLKEKGIIKRAPVVWCNLGLEWFYRLLSEPSRIKRQKILPVFALKVMLARMGKVR